MYRRFVEAKSFHKDWQALGLGDEELIALQTTILADPNVGDLIQHTGGARKIRVAFPGKGKSGSARVIYVDVVVKETIYLVMVYAKNQQESLSNEEKKILHDMIKKLKGE